MQKHFFIITTLLFITLSGFQVLKDQYDLDDLRARYSSGLTEKWPEAALDSSIDRSTFQDIGHLPEMTYPADNPYSDEKKELGKMLFFDPRLSESGQIACASCHDSELGWGDGRRNSYGHNRQLGKRNAMTILNSGYASSLFWDGRAATLEEQAALPIQDKLEMNSHISLATETIAKTQGYAPHFKAAFGDETVTEERIKKAIATFERSIVSRTSRFDLFIDGKSEAFTDREVLGLHLFRTKAQCINCHNTGYFSDNQFHNTGLTYYGRPFEDLGQYEITKNKADVGKFRTPTLREVGKTGPYMHNGLFTSLEVVVNLYNTGMPHPKRKKDQMDDPLFPTTSHLLKPLELDAQEKAALVAFMKTLSSRTYRVTPPELP
ncbi:cytochrome-c peroxidase [Fulvivirga sediminis]|uniref:Methylamine utilization protein MauG n=1 Tax=Fulvivirga sediminis TaxID=2803949 RepID=A0A937F7Q1_9BACT|nr:cytochrome c peroxidase [Fulvivirga sediminis]MBL3655819.1 c-type cytochrome [Fulvivirga sediminis]